MKKINYLETIDKMKYSFFKIMFTGTVMAIITILLLGFNSPVYKIIGCILSLSMTVYWLINPYSEKAFYFGIGFLISYATGLIIIKLFLS
jgi:hypothetical protein